MCCACLNYINFYLPNIGICGLLLSSATFTPIPSGIVGRTSSWGRDFERDRKLTLTMQKGKELRLANSNYNENNRKINNSCKKNETMTDDCSTVIM